MTLPNLDTISDLQSRLTEIESRVESISRKLFGYETAIDEKTAQLEERLNVASQGYDEATFVLEDSVKKVMDKLSLIERLILKGNDNG